MSGKPSCRRPSRISSASVRSGTSRGRRVIGHEPLGREPEVPIRVDDRVLLTDGGRTNLPSVKIVVYPSVTVARLVVHLRDESDE